MDAQVVISLVAIALATLASIVTAIALRRTTARGDFEALQKRVDVAERDLRRCKEDKESLEDRQFNLYQELYDLRKKVDGRG